jgi:uncharacterized membrane protein
MVIATLALIGFIVALYLWLWKLGTMGPLVCGTGECEVVQNSPWAVILGLPVAFYGVVGYLALLVASLVGLQPKWADRRELTALLVVLSAIGFAFTVYLTYLEAAVIRAWCRWCLVSAGIITAIFVTSLVGLRGTREQRSE